MFNDIKYKWKEERVHLVAASPRASTTPSYSPRPSTTPSYSPGPSTPPNYSGTFLKCRVLKLQALDWKDKGTNIAKITRKRSKLDKHEHETDRVHKSRKLLAKCMRTRNSNFPNNSNVTIPRRRNRGRAPNVVEPELRTIVEVAPMAERTMEELLRAPTEGYGEAIVLPEINADHFEIKTNLLQLVQASPFHGYERENPHAHINSFKRITSTLRFRDVPNDVIKLMMFPYSLEGAAKVCLKANDLRTSLNAVAGGNLLSKTTREALNIIENKSKVRYSRNKSNVSRMNTSSRESKMDERIDKLADQILTLIEIVSKKVVTLTPVKAVEEICVTCSGPHACVQLT
ncbi:hypothetical protein Tco_0531042 [Tanacetum coccineum]